MAGGGGGDSSVTLTAAACMWPRDRDKETHFNFYVMDWKNFLFSVPADGVVLYLEREQVIRM